MLATARLQPIAALALACAVGLGAASRSGAQTELSKSSPFMSVGAPTAAASGPTETIEFAAVRIIGKRTEIGLYDTHAKKNHWIPVGDTVNGMTVMSYDPRRDQVSAKIGGVNKTLTLRQTKGVAAGNAAVSTPPAMSFATTPPAPIQPASVTPAVAQTSAPPDPSTPAVESSAPVTPAATPAQPAAPLTIARQEEEARMLVSDLLEIGMAQRKAYEEKQKKAADPTAAATPEIAPSTPKPDGTP